MPCPRDGVIDNAQAVDRRPGTDKKARQPPLNAPTANTPAEERNGMPQTSGTIGVMMRLPWRSLVQSELQAERSLRPIWSRLTSRAATELSLISAAVSLLSCHMKSCADEAASHQAIPGGWEFDATS
jgi:hypothetical protein